MRIFLKVLSYVVSFILLLVVTLIALAYVYEDDIKAFALDEVNKKIETRINTGTIEVSFLRNFPYASITFPNIVVEGSTQKGALLKAEELSFLFNIKDVLSGKYQILRVIAFKGQLNILYNAEGVSNFEILKSNATKNSSEVSLNYVHLSEMNLSYIDVKEKLALEAFITDLEIDGTIGVSSIQAAIDLNSEIIVLAYNQKNLLQKKLLSFKANTQLNILSSTFDFESVISNYNGLELTGNISLQKRARGYYLVSQLHHNKISCERIFDVLDIADINFLKPYFVEGTVVGDLTFKGIIDESIPNFEWNFLIEGAKLKLEDRIFTCTTQAKLNNQQKGLLVLNNLVFQYNNIAFKASASIDHLFESPHLKSTLQTQFNLKLLKDEIPKSFFEGAIGDVSADCVFEGSLLNGANLPSLLKSARLKTNNLTLSGKEYKYLLENIVGTLQYTNDEIKIEGLQFKFNGSDVMLKGNIKDAASLLFETQKRPFQGNFNLYFTDIDLPFLLYAFGSGGSKNLNTADESSNKFSVNENLDIQLEVKAKRFTYNKLSGSNLSLTAEINRSAINVPYYEFDAVSGSFSGNGSLKANETDKTNTLKLNTSIFKADIHKLFTSFNNFGQSIIKAENINGVLNTQIQCMVQLSKSLEVDINSINAVADIEILNGSLSNVKSLESLSKYVKLDDLKDIKFETLSNQIIIKDRVVSIPSMNLKNSALDIGLSGTHTFSNEIQYNITVLLSDILDKKIRFNKNLADVGVVSDDEKSKSVIFLKMYGTVDNPEISIDREKMKMGLNQKLKEEKETFKSIFKEEFGGKHAEQSTTIPEDPSMMQSQNSGQKPSKNLSLEEQKKQLKDSTQKKGFFKKLKDNINTPIEEDN